MSGSCGLQRAENGEFRLHGDISFETAATLLDSDVDLFATDGRILLDLQGVTDFDSAGLALLLRWLAVARRRGREIEFRNVPEKLVALATISDLGDLIVGSR